MQRESILYLGEDRHTYHRLRAELRGTCYRLLLARSESAARWLIERVKISVALVTNAGGAEACATRLVWGSAPGCSEPFAGASMLVVSRGQDAGHSQISSEEDQPEAEPTPPHSVNALAAGKIVAEAGIPILQVIDAFAEGPQSTLPAAINEGADYILFAPYEQTELIQAIRTAMLNGPASRRAAPVSAPLEVALQDRMCSLETNGEQMSRLFIGAVEQLQYAKKKVSWCEAQIRTLRESVTRQELQSQFHAEGLPEVVHGVAHDFANLLEAAGAAATAVHSQPSSARMYREAIQGVMEQAHELIEYLREMTRPSILAWRTDPVELDSIVMKALKAALVPMREPHIQVRVRTAGLEPVWAHPALIHRALANLIWNPVQAMPAGGLLSIIGYARGDRVVLEVADTGSGIGTQVSKKILKESFSTKAGHSGMGLTLVRELITRCGGEVTFASRPRNGSVFSIALPIARSSATAQSGQQSTPAGIEQPPTPIATLDTRSDQTKLIVRSLRAGEESVREDH